jgi:hypothetical protein
MSGPEDSAHIRAAQQDSSNGNVPDTKGHQALAAHDVGKSVKANMQAGTSTLVDGSAGDASVSIMLPGPPQLPTKVLHAIGQLSDYTQLL